MDNPFFDRNFEMKMCGIREICHVKIQIYCRYVVCTLQTIEITILQIYTELINTFKFLKLALH